MKKEKARIAELQVEAAYFDKTTLARKLEMEIAMAKASAKLKVYEESEEEELESEKLKDKLLALPEDKQKLVEEYVAVNSHAKAYESNIADLNQPSFNNEDFTSKNKSKTVTKAENDIEDEFSSIFQKKDALKCGSPVKQSVQHKETAQVDSSV